MMKWTENYRKAVTFSYDDGIEQDIRLAALFNRYGLKATFNLNSGLNRENSTWQYKGVQVHRMNLAECLDIYKGHEIAVHGLTHMNMTEYPEAEIRKELLEDYRNLTEIFGTEPAGMAYAYGAYNDTVLKVVGEMGLKYARGVNSSHSFDVQTKLLEFRPTCHHDDEQLFDLAERFIAAEPGGPQIFYVWGHAYEFDGNRNWDRFERFLEKISGREDVFYGTNREVLL